MTDLTPKRIADLRGWAESTDWTHRDQIYRLELLALLEEVERRRKQDASPCKSKWATEFEPWCPCAVHCPEDHK